MGLVWSNSGGNLDVLAQDFNGCKGVLFFQAGDLGQTTCPHDMNVQRTVPAQRWSWVVVVVVSVVVVSVVVQKKRGEVADY